MAASIHPNVEVRKVDVRKGKGLYARKQLKAGDTILEEKPLVSSQFAWNEAYKYLACEYCLRSLETAEAMARRLTNNPALVLPQHQCCKVKIDQIVSCPQCQISYCSEECRQKALESYHKCLCMGPAHEDENHPVNRLLETWKHLHYPPETASIMLLVKMIAMVKQTADPPSLIHQFEEFIHVTVNEEDHAVHKLLGKQFQDSIELLRAQVTEYFHDDKVAQWLSPEGFRAMIALMGTNQQGIGSSSISVWVHNCDDLDLEEDERKALDVFIDQMYDELDKVSGTFLNCEGVGLYKLQSACNHSCAPNAEIEFTHSDNTLTLTALTDISPEEEITISYLDECDRERSRHSRQKALRENYLFTCTCVKCQSQADDEDVTSEEEEEEEEEMEDS